MTLNACLNSQPTMTQHFVKEVFYAIFSIKSENSFRFFCIVKIGRFLWGRVNNNGDPYYAELILDSIDLGKPGTYEISFWVAMHCSIGNSSCNSTQDSIKVIINENANDSAIYTVDFNNIENQQRWEKRAFKFTVNDSKIEVVSFNKFYFQKRP